MPVPSYEFLAFAALAALAINVSDKPGWRRAIFVVANLGFILSFTHEIARLVPFAALMASGFASVKLMERYRRRIAFIPLVIALVFAFCWLKRYTFIPHELLLPWPYFAVGMSYVFFRVLHLVIDAYQDSLPRRVGFASYLSYTLNFTCLVSGPIQLYPDYLRTESEKPAALNARAIGDAVIRIITGFFKVSVVSATLFYAQTECVKAVSASLPFGSRLAYASILLALFPVYVYFNFSGYTDFVIGAARFLRLELPENFNRPFLAVGVIDFWSRWHMTLSNWLKTYVYSPLLLSLMRRFPSRGVLPYLGVIAYFVTFFLIGAWHGQTAKFLFFGLLTGAGISVNKLYEIALARRLGRVRYQDLCDNVYYSALCRGLNFTWFCFTMLWFWSNWAQLGRFVQVFGIAGVSTAVASVWLISSAVLSLMKAFEEGLPRVRFAVAVLSFPYLRTAWYTMLAVITVSLTAILNAPAPHIVYKAF